MNNIEMNQQAVKMLEQWDPFNLGPDAYDTETADVVGALQGPIEAQELAEIIQRVYELSYEQWIDMEQCLEIAKKLVEHKWMYQCEQ